MPDTRIPPYTDSGVWAEDAETVIPVTPIPGVSYRNDTLSQAQNEAGEPYASIPDSADFNQAMYINTRFTVDSNHHGLPGWSDQVDYIARPPTNVLAAATWADDGGFYLAVQESGPGTGAGVQDPALDVGEVYWKKLTSSSTLELDLSNQSPGTEGARLVGTTGKTVQQLLDFLNDRAEKLNNLTLVFAGSFDENGILLGNGFNIKNNIAEKITSQGYQFFRVDLDDKSDFGNDTVISVTPTREVDPLDVTNVLTSNYHVIIGSWSAAGGSPVIDLTDTIKIVFTDPFNINIQQYPPFTIAGWKINRYDPF